jgi:hypothetical protein
MFEANFKTPLLVWGNGGCMNSGMLQAFTCSFFVLIDLGVTMAPLLLELASHGRLFTLRAD